MSFGDGKKCIITDVEKIDRYKTRALEKVYQVNWLKNNLLCISHLSDKENKVRFASAGYKDKKFDTNKIILTAKRY